MRIAILDDIHGAYAATAGVQRLRERADVHIFTSAVNDAQALHGFNALIANRERTRFDRSFLAQLKDVRLIVQTGNHANHIDFPAAAEFGITIAKASGGFSVGAAELAIGLIIALSRRIPSCDAAMKAGGWSTPSTQVLRGKTLGLVGLGRVGRYVAKLATAFEMNLLAWSPTLTHASAAAVNAKWSALDELCAQSDVVSLHAALTPESRGLLDDRRLKLMKPTAYLVNTARAALVDEASLIDALRSRRIAGAALDVFESEPLPFDHALRKLDNALLTPHIGWPTDEGYARFAEAAAAVVLAYMANRSLPQFT